MAFELVIVIATAERSELLGRTLDSLARCRLPPSHCRTLVVENGEPCGAADVVRDCDPVLMAHYLYEPLANKSQALNRALAELDDCLIVFADDDVRFDEQTICRYDEAARAAGAGAQPGYFFGGPTGCDYDAEPPAWLKEFLPNSARGWKLDGGQQTVAKPSFLGFNWAAFAHDLKDAGGFNPLKGPGSPSNSVGQETDMQRRLLDRGLRGLYIPDAKVWHHVPAARCSDEWASQRAYRSGVCIGLNGLLDDEFLGSFPLVRQFASSAKRLVFTRHHSPARARFIIQQLRNWSAGYRTGCRERANAKRLELNRVNPLMQLRATGLKNTSTDFADGGDFSAGKQEPPMNADERRSERFYEETRKPGKCGEKNPGFPVS